MKANVGMIYPVAALVDEYTPNEGITYESGFVVAEAREANLSWEDAQGEFYGDDTLLDSDVGIISYTLTFEPSGLHSSVRATLLGEKTLDDDKGYRITGATPPEIGFGFIKHMREDVDGAVTDVYEAWWFWKLKFNIESEQTRTKERNIEWRVPTLTGRGSGVYLEDDEIAFADHKDFETMSGAKAWLNDKAGIVPETTTT